MLDSDGKTALHLACTEGHYDIVVQLLRSLFYTVFPYILLEVLFKEINVVWDFLSGFDEITILK